MCCSTKGCDREVRKCEWCGSELPIESPSRGRPTKYCSGECRKADRALGRQRRECANCGTAEVSVGQRFCTDACKEQWATTPCACAGCGQEFFRSPSLKPAKWCSKRCRNATRRRPRVTAACHKCLDCGVEIHRPDGARGRRRLRCAPCQSEHQRTQAALALVGRFVPTKPCRRCGKLIDSPHRRSYCSDECRWLRRRWDSLVCGHCGGEFRCYNKHQKYCSLSCHSNARWAPSRAFFNCLKCDKKCPVKSGRRQNKYCSRDCAYAARKEKKPYARRPLDTARSCQSYLAAWRKKRDWLIEVESLRWAPERPVRAAVNRPSRMCRQCNSAEAARGSKGSLCESCGTKRTKAIKREARKRRRQKHGGDSYRKRCRRFNAPYTPIKRSSIYDRDNWACQICGVELLRKYLRTSAGVDPRSPTLDHIIPLCLGPDGPGHVETNVQAACFDCNSRKGASLLDSFAPAAANKLP